MPGGLLGRQGVADGRNRSALPLHLADGAVGRVHLADLKLSPPKGGLEVLGRAADAAHHVEWLRAWALSAKATA